VIQFLVADQVIERLPDHASQKIFSIARIGAPRIGAPIRAS